jgi:hypothetical protein
MVNLIELYELCKNKDELLSKLQEWGLVPKQWEYRCPNCKNPMKLCEKKDEKDGWRWECRVKVQKRAKGPWEKCDTFVKFRKGTLFAASKLGAFQV